MNWVKTSFELFHFVQQAANRSKGSRAAVTDSAVHSRFDLCLGLRSHEGHPITFQTTEQYIIGCKKTKRAPISRDLHQYANTYAAFTKFKPNANQILESAAKTLTWEKYTNDAKSTHTHPPLTHATLHIQSPQRKCSRPLGGRYWFWAVVAR